jgi:hypothetical protein
VSRNAALWAKLKQVEKRIGSNIDRLSERQMQELPVEVLFALAGPSSDPRVDALVRHYCQTSSNAVEVADRVVETLVDEYAQRRAAPGG